MGISFSENGGSKNDECVLLDDTDTYGDSKYCGRILRAVLPEDGVRADAGGRGSVRVHTGMGEKKKK